MKRPGPSTLVALAIALGRAFLLLHHASVLDRSGDLFATAGMAGIIQELLVRQVDFHRMHGRWASDAELESHEYGRGFPLRLGGTGRAAGWVPVSVREEGRTVLVRARPAEMAWLRCTGRVGADAGAVGAGPAQVECSTDGLQRLVTAFRIAAFPVFVLCLGLAWWIRRRWSESRGLRIAATGAALALTGLLLVGLAASEFYLPNLQATAHTLGPVLGDSVWSPGFLLR